MAEVLFGAISGSIGIATAFTACVECFGYTKLGQNLGRDFQTSQLTLTSARRLRVSRWGEAVQVYDDPCLGRPTATAAELQNAENTLSHIQRLFEESDALSRKDRQSAKIDDLLEYSVDDLGPASAALNNKMTALCCPTPEGGGAVENGCENGQVGFLRWP